MFYNQLVKLCEQNNTTPSAVIAKLGLGSSNVTRWKNGTAPNSDVVLLFAEYFNVSTDYLLLGKQSENGLTTDQQELLQLYDKLDEIQKAEVRGFIQAKAGTFQTPKEVGEGTNAKEDEYVELTLVASGGDNKTYKASKKAVEEIINGLEAEKMIQQIIDNEK